MPRQSPRSSSIRARHVLIGETLGCSANRQS
jgi:hypothetical protein